MKKIVCFFLALFLIATNSIFATVSDNYSPVKAIGNSATVNFAFSWALVDDDNMRVYLEDVSTGIQTLQTKDIDYTVTFNDSTPGGTVTFTTAPTSSYYVILAREIPKTQSIPLKTSSGFNARVVESMLDKLTVQCQDLQEQINRSILVPLGSSSTPDYAELLSTAATTTQSYANMAVSAASNASASALNASNSASEASSYVATCVNANASAVSSAASASASAIAAAASESTCATYSNNIALNVHEETSTAGQTTIDITAESWDLATDKKNISIYIDGIRQAPSTFTRTSSTVITLGGSLTAGKNITLISADISGSVIDALSTYAYPVGSIYISTVSTNPATLLGFGTWTAFGAGRVLTGIDATQTEFDTVKETGGNKTHIHTIPSLTVSSTTADEYDGGGQVSVGAYGSSITVGNGGYVGSAVGLSPYIVVYMWERTA